MLTERLGSLDQLDQKTTFSRDFDARGDIAEESCYSQN